MTTTEQQSFLLMARGNSHIRYFRQIQQHTSLTVQVIQVGTTLPMPWDLKYWSQLSQVDLNGYLITHFAKKEKKFPRLSKTLLWGAYKVISRFNTKLQLCKYSRLISNSNADVVGVWNGQKLPSSSIKLAAESLGKRVVHFENGLLPDTTVCDWQGVNCHNSLPRDADFYRRFSDVSRTLPDKLIQRQAVKAKARALDEDALPEKYLFVPLQMETDSQIISNSPWIKSMQQLWQALADAIDQCQDPALRIVIKEHPSEKTSFRHLHDQHDKILFSNQCTTQVLIENATAVATINSTVGVESLLLGQKLMVLGNACYGLPGLCQLAGNQQQLNAALNGLDSFEPDETLRQGFLKFLCHYYSIPKTWSNTAPEHFSALEKRLTLSDEFSKQIKDV